MSPDLVYSRTKRTDYTCLLPKIDDAKNIYLPELFNQVSAKKTVTKNIGGNVPSCLWLTCTLQGQSDL